MNIQWLDQFLYKPTKLRYSIITDIFIVMWFACYFLFIVPIKEQLDSALYEQETLKHDIALLTQKIANYPSSQQLLEQMNDLENDMGKNHLSMKKQLNQISQQLLNSPLKLIDFDNQSTINQWQFKLQGHYADFIIFFTELVALNLNHTIRNLLIHKQKDSLDFTLCLQHDAEKEE